MHIQRILLLRAVDDKIIMECPLLRGGVAAAALALRVKPECSPVKTEAAAESNASKSEPSPVFGLKDGSDFISSFVF